MFSKEQVQIMSLLVALINFGLRVSFAGLLRMANNCAVLSPGILLSWFLCVNHVLFPVDSTAIQEFDRFFENTLRQFGRWLSCFPRRH